MTTRKIYNAEFKRQAIELAAREDVGLIRATRDLGISTVVLYHWRLQAQKAGQAAFPGQGRSTLTPQEQEIQRLRKEVEILRQEREILKKAAAFFARELTNQDSWSAIGYDVEGQFRSGQQVTLTRSAHNSPNPLPQFTTEPLVQFTHYPTRSQELQALSAAIKRNLTEDALKPSRNILVVVPGLEWRPYNLQKEVFAALRQAGISVYLPGNKDADVPKQEWPNTDPNGFWKEGSVTVSPVMQAKGNEADVVYVVGLDQIASQEDNIKLRNQLFVGISRSKGWVHLSGSDMAGSPLTDEIERVIAAGATLDFTYRQPRRKLDDLE